MNYSATDIVSYCENARKADWPRRMRELMLEEYFNGNALPYDDSDENPTSLGIGYRFMSEPMDMLLSGMDDPDGPISCKLRYPANSKRAMSVQRSVEEELNRIVLDRYQSTLRAAAGRTLITGRAFLTRRSRWDLFFKPSRLLHANEYGDDVLDDSFMEWGVMGQLKWGEIDGLIDRADGSKTINKQGLLEIKRWALEKSPDGQGKRKVSNQMLESPMGDEWKNEPLDVYFYWRKQEERGITGERKVDLYIVSRYGEWSDVSIRDDGTSVTKTFTISNSDKDREQVIWSQEGAFESILETLVPLITDERVSGEQKMGDLAGQGKILIPRLLENERLTSAVIDGIATAMAPNYRVTGPIDEDDLRLYAEQGLQPHAIMPNGLDIANKNQMLPSVGGAQAVMEHLNFSVEQDAGTGGASTQLGRNRLGHRATAELFAENVRTGASRRLDRWNRQLDRLWEQVGSTICRSMLDWREDDPSFRQVLKFNQKLIGHHHIDPSEYLAERWEFRARRIPGGGTRQEGLNKAMMLMQPGMSAQVQQAAQREAVSITWGEHYARDLFDPQEEQQRGPEMESATLQEAAALNSLRIEQPQPGDDPIRHLAESHIPTIEAHLQQMQQAGKATPEHATGLQMLIQHASFDAANLPGIDLQQQAGRALQEYMKVLQGIEVATPMSKPELDQMKLQNQIQRDQHLMQTRDTQEARKNQESFENTELKRRATLTNERNTKVAEDRLKLDAATK